MGKEDKIKDALNKAHDAAEIGKVIPGVGGRAQDLEDVIETAQAAIGIFDRFKALFAKKKKK